MEKLFIDSNKLLKDSFKIAWNVFESGFRPNYIVGVWRGGAPIGIAVQELLDLLGVKSDHIAIRTSSYESMGKKSKDVQVHGLNYVIKKVESEDSLLIVDDVHDTGLSIDKIIKDLQNADTVLICGENYINEHEHVTTLKKIYKQIQFGYNFNSLHECKGR